MVFHRIFRRFFSGECFKQTINPKTVPFIKCRRNGPNHQQMSNTFCFLSGNKMIFCISSGLAPSRTSMRSSTRSTRTAATRSSSQSSLTGRLKRTSISKMTMTTFKLYLSTSTIALCLKRKRLTRTILFKVKFKATQKWPRLNHMSQSLTKECLKMINKETETSTTVAAQFCFLRGHLVGRHDKRSCGGLSS